MPIWPIPPMPIPLIPLIPPILLKSDAPPLLPKKPPEFFAGCYCCCPTIAPIAPPPIAPILIAGGFIPAMPPYCCGACGLLSGGATTGLTRPGAGTAVGTGMTNGGVQSSTNWQYLPVKPLLHTHTKSGKLSRVLVVRHVPPDKHGLLNEPVRTAT